MKRIILSFIFLINVGTAGNICCQTKELYKGIWYTLNSKQKEKSIDLFLESFYKDRIVVSGLTLNRRYIIKNVLLYDGISLKGKLITIGIESIYPYTLNVIIGNLQAKKYICKKGKLK